MSRTKRNRFYLLGLKRRRRLVDQGIKVLTGKRDALRKEFHDMLRDVATARKELDGEIRDAWKTLTIARGMEPHSGLSTAAETAKREITFTVSTRNVWGVRIPSVNFPDATRPLFGRGSAPLYRSPAVDETAARFEEVINALVKSAALDNRMERIGGALKSTSRRVNALEQRVLPEIKEDIRDIENYLEEMSREDTFRMKRFKYMKSQKTGTDNLNPG